MKLGLASKERLHEIADAVASTWPDQGAACEIAMDTAQKLLEELEKQKADRPVIVCLCGSTRFKDEFVKAGLRETLAGKIVLTIGCDLRTDDEAFGHLSVDERAKVKARLDELHLCKIDVADETLVLNKNGYIGESTGNELAYARKMGKRIRFLEPEKAPSL